MSCLLNKTILIGVTGGIAAYKMPNLVSMLVKAGACVHVFLTESGAKFITPAPFEALTGNRCLSDTFERSYPPEIHHISIAKKADLVLIAPASANVIGKMANGIADDLLTSTILACTCPRLFSPAMNTRMFENPIVQDNIKKLEKYGFTSIYPNSGHLACGDVGAGKMPEPSELFEYIENSLHPKDMLSLNVLVTAGPTMEAIDPVRFVTNHSSGKMGFAIARAAMLRGANVTLVSGPTTLEPLPFVNTVPVVSSEDMFNAVTSLAAKNHIIIKAAAPADYTPENYSAEKIKKTGDCLELKLNKTKDILKYLGENRSPNQFLCGFAMETENALENSRKKLYSKKIDLIAANSLKVDGAGFKGDTNVLTLINANEEIALNKMSKDEAAHKLLDTILKMRG